MKKQLSIRHLLLGAWNHFTEYFMHWVMLFGIQWIIIAGFFICSSATLALLHYFFIDLGWFDGVFKEYAKIFTIFMISIMSVCCLFFMMVFPVMYKQNALDVVFKRSMSGFDVNNRFFSYAVAMLVYWMIVFPAFLCGIFPGIFLAQRWRFVGLHILDHGGNVRNAFASSWKMTRGYVWFLVGVSMIQSIIFLFCGPTIIFALMAIALNRLIDANIYKQLHIEYDKGISVCACEA